MTNKTKKVLEYVALNPGATQDELEHLIMLTTAFSDQDYHTEQVFAKGVLETLVQLKLLSRRPGPEIGLNENKIIDYGPDRYYITDTTPYRYGVAFGKTVAISLVCPSCDIENFINPFGNLTKPRKCRHCKTELLPPRLQPIVELEPGDGGFDMERSKELKENDIVVTCPLINQGYLDEKIEDPENSFWDFKKKPQRLTEANRVFVVFDGAIRYNFGIGEIEDGPLDPVEDAGGHNPGVPEGGCRVWFSDQWALKEPIPFKGFQGFRYRWW